MKIVMDMLMIPYAPAENMLLVTYLYRLHTLSLEIEEEIEREREKETENSKILLM